MNNGSIVDYLNSTGQKSDYASRSQLAASKGIIGYTGTAAQNTQLLNMLRGNTQPIATPTNQTNTNGINPVNQNQTSQPNNLPNFGGSVSSPVTGNFSLVQALISRGYNAVDAQNAANGPRAAELANEYLGGGTATGSSGLIVTPQINLPDLYNNLYSQSGISQVQSDLEAKTRDYNTAVSKIKDNPYLSEATMSGRLAKLQDRFNADTAASRNEIATRKADIETQLNLRTKQFDIQNQQAQQALSQFNSLLASGALSSASGEDIANITRSTGLSSSVIQSAINNQKLQDLSTQIKTFDDGTNEGFVIYTLDKMGNIVNQTKQITGSSAKKVNSYSSDPSVSAYIQSILESNNIQSGWSSI